MALNPALKQMVADAKAKYEGNADRQADNDDEPEAVYFTALEQLVILGLRKATKRELRQIIVNVMATGAA